MAEINKIHFVNSKGEYYLLNINADGSVMLTLSDIPCEISGIPLVDFHNFKKEEIEFTDWAKVLIKHMYFYHGFESDLLIKIHNPYGYGPVYKDTIRLNFTSLRITSHSAYLNGEIDAI